MHIVSPAVSSSGFVTGPRLCKTLYIPFSGENSPGHMETSYEVD